MTPQPTQIRRLPDAIAVEWYDGHRSEYSYQLLRQECPCARCKSAKPDKNPLRLLPANQFLKNLKVIDIQLVGRYAIRLTWNDRHKTGIYTFEFLRSLDPTPTEAPTG